jgi:branched-chain amino acid aminotransferase
VAETNATHVFVVERGMVRTSRTVACPEGITRAAVLDLCRTNAMPFEVCDLTLTEVYRAAEAFCTGTMGELAPIAKVDGRAIGTEVPGPLTRRLTALFTKLTQSEGVQLCEPAG